MRPGLWWVAQYAKVMCTLVFIGHEQSQGVSHGNVGRNFIKKNVLCYDHGFILDKRVL
jgi:hypothetical protein